MLSLIACCDAGCATTACIDQTSLVRVVDCKAAGVVCKAVGTGSGVLLWFCSLDCQALYMRYQRAA